MSSIVVSKLKNSCFQLCILILLIMVNTDMHGQKTRTKQRPSEEEKKEVSAENPLLNQLNPELKIGVFNIAGNFFSISFKGNCGYKLTDWLSSGVALKFGNQFYNNFGQSNDFSFQDYGAGVYARGRIFNQVYLQAEYDYYNIPDIQTGFPYEGRSSFWSPLVGGGYAQGWGDWRFSLELLFILNDQVRDYKSFAEYWIGFSYNF